jgi:LEA14-like dessication related protein
MTIARALITHFITMATLLFLSGCATMSLDYTEPNVELVSFKALPVKGFEQNFEIGLKLTNPNNFELPINGISYQLSVAGETLAHGVASDIPTAKAYGESRFVVPVSTSLIGGFKVIKVLLDSQKQKISYQLKSKIDIGIPFVPKLVVIQDGIIPFGQKKRN